MQRMNERPMRHLGLTRRELFEKIERDALTPLPPRLRSIAEWRRARVNLDYHIEIDKHFYSAPFRCSATRSRCASPRARSRSSITASGSPPICVTWAVSTTTLADHMPSSHRRYADWTHERIRREAGTIGDDAAALVELILRSRPHPEQGFRSCIGILRLVSRYDAERFDAACARALDLGTRSYSSVAAILKNAQDRKPREPDQPSLFARKHPRPRLLPLKGETMLTHPLAEHLRGLGMAAMADAFLEMQSNSTAAELSHEDWLGLLLDREVTAQTTSVSDDGCAKPDCARTLWSRTRTSAHRVVSTVRCSLSSPAVTGSVTPASRDRRPDRVGDMMHSSLRY